MQTVSMRAVVALTTAACCFGSAMAAAPTGDVRDIAVPGSIVKARVWTEARAGGATQSMYSVALDGVNFSAPIATSYEVELTSAPFEPFVNQPAIPAGFAAGDDVNVYVVQFHTQSLAAYQHAIEALGGTLGRHVPNNAMIVEMSPQVRDAVAAQPFVRWVGKFEPAARVSAELLAASDIDALDDTLERYSIEVQQRGPEQQESLKAYIESLGGEVHFITPQAFRMEATMPRAALPLVARADEVNNIDYSGGPGGYDDQNARGTAGSNAIFIADTLGYTGQGVRGQVFDGGLRETHDALDTPAVLFQGTNSSDRRHGTNCYGIVFGDGTANFNSRGYLPDAEQGSFCRYGQATQFTGGTIPRHQLTAELVDPNGPFRCVIQSSSVGNTQITTYSNISAEVDDYLFLYDLLSCQSQSNTQTRNSRPQAWAKNIVSVGGIRHFNNANRADDTWDANATGSSASIGPAEDGRVKPDLAHFYDNIDTTDSDNDTDYTTGFGGTSGATPCTAGTFGILFQMWHEGVWAGHGGGASVFASRPKMATAKALMINSAYQYPLAFGEPGSTDITRNSQGWGMPDLQALYLSASKTYVVNESDPITPLDTNTYYVRMGPDADPFKVTMVYTDLAGNPNVQSQHRVNDLSLKVSSPDDLEYWGNNGLATARWSTPGGSPNIKDTVENVFVQTPVEGWWMVQVIGSQIVADSRPESPALDADYALIINGGAVFGKGDMNCDGDVNFGDIDPFVAALQGAAPYQAAYPTCLWVLGDIDEDLSVNFGDIDGFVTMLGQ